MKDLISPMVGLIILLTVLFMIHDADAEEKNTQLIMERFNRVQILYDAGLEEYANGNKFEGCSLLRRAVKESKWIGDDGQTLRQVQPVFEATCKGDKNG